MSRAFSFLSLLGSIATWLTVLSPPDRGIDFSTNMLVIFIFFAQLTVFFLFVFVAVIVASYRGGIRLTRFGAVLILIAMLSLASQFFCTPGHPSGPFNSAMT